jgi:hypothetical protein
MEDVIYAVAWQIANSGIKDDLDLSMMILVLLAPTS